MHLIMQEIDVDEEQVATVLDGINVILDRFQTRLCFSLRLFSL